MSAPLAIGVISLVWLAIGLVTGSIGHRIPARLLGHDTWLTRPRAFERQGRFYSARLGIQGWKDRLPEAGGLFRGGFSKRHIRNRSTANLVRFVTETRRAEYVHWMNIIAGALFLLFLPAWAGFAMVVFALMVHLPFVCIQRYNRARLVRTLERRDTHQPLRVQGAHPSAVVNRPAATSLGGAPGSATPARPGGAAISTRDVPARARRAR